MWIRVRRKRLISFLTYKFELNHTQIVNVGRRCLYSYLSEKKNKVLNISVLWCAFQYFSCCMCGVGFTSHCFRYLTFRLVSLALLVDTWNKRSANLPHIPMWVSEEFGSGSVSSLRWLERQSKMTFTHLSFDSWISLQVYKSVVYFLIQNLC